MRRRDGVSESLGSGGGKMKSSSALPRRINSRASEQMSLPEAAPMLPNASLPKLNFTAPLPFSCALKPAGAVSSTVTSSFTTSTSATSTTNGDAFKFSVPEVLTSKSNSSNGGLNMTGSASNFSSTYSEDSTTSLFNFSAPFSVVTDEISSKDNFVVPQSSFVPKLKSVKPPSPIVTSSLESTRELITKPGGLLAFLNQSNDNNIKENINVSNSNAPSFTPTSSVSNVTSDTTATSSTTLGFGERFKAAAGSWECDGCLLRNKADKTKCIACDTPKPGCKSDAPAPQTSAFGGSSVSFGVSAAPSVSQGSGFAGFGSAFKKSSGDWDCDSCLLRNKGDVTACVACQATKPGAAPAPSSASTSIASSSASSFSFGIAASSSTATSSSSGFSFGVQSTSQASVASSSFSFGVKPSTSSSASTSVSSTFSAASSNPGTSSLFGSSAENSKNKSDTQSKPSPSKDSLDNIATSSNDNLIQPLPLTGFGDKFKKAAGSWECEVCMVSNGPSSEKCLSCESPKPGSGAGAATNSLGGSFKFGADKSSSSSDFKFGAGSSTSTQPSLFGGAISSSSTFSAPSFGFSAAASTTSAAAPESGKSAFNFGAPAAAPASNGSMAPSLPNFSSSPALKTKSSETTPKPTPELKTGSMLDFLKNSSPVNNSKAAHKPFSSKPDTVPAFSQPAAPDANKALFTFGPNSASSKSGTATNFFNSTPSLNNDEGRNANNKRSLNADNSTPSQNKLSNSFSKNNGIAEPNSILTFGKTSSEASNNVFPFQGNKTNANNSFGAPSLAFGSPAPASIFGNNNNNTMKPATGTTPMPSQGFAFGQPAEKKPSAGYDFGHAATPSAAFNFSGSTAAPSPAAPPAFKFGQVSYYSVGLIKNDIHLA